MSAVFAALALVATLHAQSNTALDRAAAAMTGTEASFTHRFTPKGFKNSQVESGTVVFGRLPMMRFSYTKPEQKLFVFDGDRSWFYVPGDKQVTIADVDASRKRELPFLLLGDPSARDKHFVVKQSGRVTTLKPRDSAAIIRTVSITTGADNRISHIEYTDREGNRTSFDLSGYHPRAASADTFHFTPPAGVQVVSQ
ncbi:MAG TPA: outer membrane lipoprotein chaperone LolA [Thermoanaerobaculia bacterium]|nr:outer membrane lipoprotein chaperone LolA [Thermoanaerobaculia bacterium]